MLQFRCQGGRRAVGSCAPASGAPSGSLPQRGPFAGAKPLSKARSWQAVSLACVAVPSAPGVSVFGFIRPAKIHYIPHFLDATL